MTSVKARDWRQIRFPQPLWLRMEDVPEKKAEDLDGEEYAALYGVIDVDDNERNKRKKEASPPAGKAVQPARSNDNVHKGSSASGHNNNNNNKSSSSQTRASEQKTDRAKRDGEGERGSHSKARESASREKGSDVQGKSAKAMAVVEEVDVQKKENVQYLRDLNVKETPQAQQVQRLMTGGFPPEVVKKIEEGDKVENGLDSDLDSQIMALKNSVKNLEVATLEQDLEEPSTFRGESQGSEILRKLKEMDALFHPEDKTVPWNDFYRALGDRVPMLKEAERLSPNGKTDVSWILKLATGAHINDTLHYSKYRIISTFFGPLVSSENLKALLDFYKDKVTGRPDYTLDKKIGWFQGVLLPAEEEALLNSVTPQTFIVTFGAEESTLVFAYNDFDDDSRKTTSTFLISIVFNPETNKFTGMDMENPDSDEDVEYATLYEIVALFKKLGFRPLGCHVLFGSG